jgi:hypothetical protein
MVQLADANCTYFQRLAKWFTTYSPKEKAESSKLSLNSCSLDGLGYVTFLNTKVRIFTHLRLIALVFILFISSSAASHG